MTIRRPPGSNTVFSSEKKAKADGKERTPAPIMLLARLKVDEDIVASPVSVDDTAAAYVQNVYNYRQKYFFENYILPIAHLL